MATAKYITRVHCPFHLWLQERQAATRARALAQQMEAAAAVAAGQSSGSEHGATSSRSAGASVRGEVLDVFGEAQVDDSRRLRRRAMSADDIAGMPPQQQTAAPRLAPTFSPPPQATTG